MNTRSHRSSLIHPVIRQAFEIKKTALPWNRAISAGICLGLPSLIGLLLGRFDYGLLAGTGGFTYLYAFNEPYVLRARKLFFTMLGLGFSVFCGSLLSPYPVLSAVVLGLIGALATFMFGALKFKGPAALFFVLSFALASGMPHGPSEALTRGMLVILGGALAWLIAMAGWLTNPYGPEIQTLRALYRNLAELLNAAGTEKYTKARHETLISMVEAETAFAGQGSSWREPGLVDRLLRLFRQAHVIYQTTDTWNRRRKEPLPAALGQAVNSASAALRSRGKLQVEALRELEDDPQLQDILQPVKELSSIVQQDSKEAWQGGRLTGTPAKSIFLGAFDKNSLVFLLSLRFGIILTIAALAAHAFNLNRSYWVPLSCASVMLGSTVIATFHRAIQRSIGTIIGILAASAILWAQPEGFVISVAIMLFTFFAELLIVRNYAIAILFVTPNALLMAEASSHIHNVAYFAGTRIVDVITGSVIGLIGVLLLGRRSASSRIPYLMGRTIRSQSQMAAMLFTEQPATYRAEDSREQRYMKTNLTNLTTVYATALGEIPRSEAELQRLLPVVWALDQFAYLLNSYARTPNRPELPDPELARLLLSFEKTAQSAEQQRSMVLPEVPELALAPKVRQELISLQAALEKSLAAEAVSSE
ncbi:FUSC family protein [Paenibacillus sp. HJL G12]|uniref:FUSC family protein n=1 Tax=Paenibacillus dendrobii TaxID=2691084 RepID=A0A7X3LHH5_9BACL|nr:FUSC family protein [Paenibacillus dendrobii]MWV45831.1 FUSC family protein [Paenibacillus dendrobii]